MIWLLGCMEEKLLWLTMFVLTKSWELREKQQTMKDKFFKGWQSEEKTWVVTVFRKAAGDATIHHVSGNIEYQQWRSERKETFKQSGEQIALHCLSLLKTWTMGYLLWVAFEWANSFFSEVSLKTYYVLHSS